MQWQYRHTVLTLCTLAFFVTMVARLAISPVVPDIVDDFGVSNAILGLALTLLWLSYSLAQFPSGVLADRFGERPIILLAIGGTGVATLLIVISPVFGLFLFSTLLLGCFAGLHYSVATTLLTRTYDDIGTAIGLHNTGSPVAGVLTPVVVAWIAVRYGWRPAVAVGALIAFPTLVLFFWRVRPTPPRRPSQPMRDRVDLKSVTDLLSRPPIAFTVFVAVACEFAWQATASFLPAFLAGYHGLSTTLAGMAFGAYFVIQGVVQIVVGNASDRVGRDPTIIGCLVASIAAFSVLVVGSGPVAVAVGVLLLGIGMSFMSALLPRFLDHLSSEEQGMGFGLVRTVYGVLGSTGSVGVGLLSDGFGWGIAFGFLAVPTGFALCALSLNAVLDWGY
ncbi:MFS transporter [Natronosalvus rutilus]|uniref:MFS transporter n=1 Tax=Natronosalvus rutilus TaxID=2953753 RepID=A0A9E7NF90_9EURY|nr:MFS transporter [Natronosalvus rutilus]UTF55758.1 MFS transporter [Natronosalvus rutilus]